MSETYKALFFGKYGDVSSIFIQEVGYQDLQPDQVLVKMEYNTLMQGDIAVFAGGHPMGPLPSRIGFGGSGTVIKAGASDLASNILNKRVSIFEFGSFAEYIVCNVNLCFPLEDNVSFKDGASIVRNPMTIMAMIEQVNEGNHKALINNAAAGSLGKMLIKYCRFLGLPLVNLVRKPEQVELLKEKYGAEHVIFTSEEN